MANKRSGLVDFVSAFGPAAISGMSTYVNLMSVINAREFNQQLGLGNRMTALTSAVDSYQKSLIDYDGKIREQGAHPSSELVTARKTVQDNLDLTRAQLKGIYGQALQNTGLNSGLANSLYNSNPSLIQNMTSKPKGFINEFKSSFDKATTDPVANPVIKTAPDPTADPPLSQTDSSKIEGSNNHDDLQKTLQADLFKRIKIDPVELTPDQYNIIKAREHYLTEIGDAGKRRNLFEQALSIQNDKDFFTVYQGTKPDDKDGNLIAFKQIERVKSLLDNTKNLYKTAPGAVGTGVQSGADVLSKFSEDRTIEARKKLNANEQEYIIFARDIKGPPSGANISPNEYLGITAGFPKAGDDNGTFERDLNAFELRVNKLYQGLLTNVKQSGKDYGQYENPDYLLQDRSTELNKYDTESLSKLPVANWDRVTPRPEKATPATPKTVTPESSQIKDPVAPQNKVKEKIEFDGMVFDEKEGTFKNPKFKPTSSSPKERPDVYPVALGPGKQGTKRDVGTTPTVKPGTKFKAVDSFKAYIKQNPKSFIESVKTGRLNGAAKEAARQALQELKAEGWNVQF